jgi:hypothetical protein
MTKKMCEPKREEIHEGGENCIMRSLVIYIPCQMLFSISRQRGRWVGKVVHVRGKK